MYPVQYVRVRFKFSDRLLGSQFKDGGNYNGANIQFLITVNHFVVDCFSFAGYFTGATFTAAGAVQAAPGFRHGCLLVKAKFYLSKGALPLSQVKHRHGCPRLRLYPFLGDLFDFVWLPWPSLTQVDAVQIAVDAFRCFLAGGNGPDDIRRPGYHVSAGEDTGHICL
ncbi:hypothetical protein ES703_31258 [subsurface metagenome]